MEKDMMIKHRKPFSISSRLKSFRWAFEGIVEFFAKEHNAWIHAFATIIVIILSIFYKIHGVQLLFLVFSMGLVWVAEIFNTCIERSMDLITLEKRKEIKYIKDLAAAGVLIAAIVAGIAGLIIFLPKIFWP